MTHVHEAMHACAVCVPCGSTLQFPLDVSQLYMGVGGGVGGAGVGGAGVGALHEAMHASALCAKSCSAASALSGGLMPRSQDLSASQSYSSAAWVHGGRRSRVWRSGWGSGA